MTVSNELLDEIGSGHRRHTAEADGRCQQISHRDRSFRGNRAVELWVDALEHLTIRKFRQPAVHGMVEPEPAIVNQSWSQPQ
jgi:hypothetical protein